MMIGSPLTMARDDDDRIATDYGQNSDQERNDFPVNIHSYGLTQIAGYADTPRLVQSCGKSAFGTTHLRLRIRVASLLDSISYSLPAWFPLHFLFIYTPSPQSVLDLTTLTPEQGRFRRHMALTGQEAGSEPWFGPQEPPPARQQSENNVQHTA